MRFYLKKIDDLHKVFACMVTFTFSTIYLHTVVTNFNYFNFHNSCNHVPHVCNLHLLLTESIAYILYTL